MPCNCSQYIDCGETFEPQQQADLDSSGQYSHTYTNESTVTNLTGITFLDKTIRSFNISGTKSIKEGDLPEYYVACDQFLSCNVPAPVGNTFSGSVSESCVREQNIPYYIDRKNEIYVYRYGKQSLSFNVSSSKSAQFKSKFGYDYFNKFCIPTSATVKGSEQFLLFKNGIKTILAETTYEYLPYPDDFAGGGTYTLYGNQTDGSGTAPETANVAMIILYGNVPKIDIALDADVVHYGFYDYNAMDGGFVENSLSKDDGGKDYFYPYWCRNMFEDKTWRKTADDRYLAIYDNTLNLAGSSQWTQPDPVVYELPFGSFVVNSKEDFIYSCMLKFSDRAGGNGMIVNYSSFGDLYDAIYVKNKLQGKPFNVLYPASPL